MTIQIGGHVQTVTNGGNGPNKIKVEIQLEMEKAEGATLTIHMPKSDAPHWLVGRQVSITAYTLEPTL